MCISYSVNLANPGPPPFVGSLAISSLAVVVVTIILTDFWPLPLGAKGSTAQLIVIRLRQQVYTCRIFTPQSSLILADKEIRCRRRERERERGGGEEVFLNYRKTPTRGKSLASLAEENGSGPSKSLALAYCTCYH